MKGATRGPNKANSRSGPFHRGCLARVDPWGGPKYVSMTGVVSKGFVVKVYVAL